VDKTCCRVSGRDNAIDDDDVMMMIMMMIPLKMIKVMRMMMLLMVVQLMIIMSIFIIINDITFFFFIMTIILLRRNYKYETSIRQLQQCLRSGRLHGWIDKMQRLANTLSTRKMISSCSLLLVIVNKEIMEIIRRCNEMTNA